jgi:hypothetical protein
MTMAEKKMWLVTYRGAAERLREKPELSDNPEFMEYLAKSRQKAREILKYKGVKIKNKKEKKYA